MAREAVQDDALTGLAWRQATRGRLGKKSSFEAAVHELAKAVTACPAAAADPAIAELVDRSFILLKSRYTSRALWQAGRSLYVKTAEAVDRCSQTSSTIVCHQRFLGYVKACDEHLNEDDIAESSTPATSVLFEGQLSSGTELPPQRRGLEELLTLAALQFPAAPDSDAGVAEGDEAMPAAPGEIDAALEQELEAAIAASLAHAEADGARPGGPPPAAKFAVRALRTEVLTAEGLAALGAGVECCVCREELAAGESVQVMPCSSAHAFHPPCLKPWLQKHNSCPICRHELPTDDERYERRKVREAQEAEDRMGAANAVTHMDFLYT